MVAAETIRDASRVAVLVLSHYLDSRYAMRLIEDHPGGSATCSRSASSNLALLIDALPRLREGEFVIDPTIVRPGSVTATIAAGELTDREREVLGLLAEGLSNQAWPSGSS